MVLPLSMSGPWNEVTKLPIVSVICEPHLWADEQDLPVMDDHTAVVNDILVYDWPVFKRVEF